MARNDQKTNSAQSGGDADESEIEEREGALGDEEVTDGDPIDGTQEAATGDNVGAPSWGFEEKKKRFSKEIVIAFLAITLLVSAFGFFVWQKFQKPATPKQVVVALTEPPTQEPDKEDPFREPVETEPANPMPPAGNEFVATLPPQSEPSIDGALGGDPFGKNEFAANDKPARPAGLFDRNPEPVEMKQPNFPVEAAIGNSEPAATEPPMTETARVETVVENRTGEPAFSSAPEPVEQPRSFDEPRPMREPDFGQPAQPEPEPPQFAEPIRRRPVEPAPFAEEPATLEPMPAHGEFYIVQEGDTFWDISKKLYGKHGYFLALYDHNRDAIPNADLMQPGTRLRTPDANVLKPLATKLAVTSKPVRMAARVSADDRVMSGTTVARSRRGVEEEAGIYVTEKGLPMYRVGDKDTLMKIAVDHLGRAERWKQIYNMNRDQMKSEQDLQPGAELRLPADASRVPLAANSHSGR